MKFLESREDENNIKKLANTVLDISSNSFGFIIPFKQTFDQYYKYPILVDLSDKDVISLFKDTNQKFLSFVSWISENIQILFLFTQNEHMYDFSGQYKSKAKQIVVVIQGIYLKDIKQFFGQNGSLKNSQTKKEFKTLFGKALVKSLETLIHELTHAYDDYQSKGKYINKKYVAYSGSKPDEGNLDYYNNPIETNAFYTAAISQLDEFDRLSDFNTYQKLFIDKYTSFKHLNKKSKERLLKRIYQRWIEPFNSKFHKFKINFCLIKIMEGESINSCIEDKRFNINVSDIKNLARGLTKKVLALEKPTTLYKKKSRLLEEPILLMQFLAGDIRLFYTKENKDISSLSDINKEWFLNHIIKSKKELIEKLDLFGLDLDNIDTFLEKVEFIKGK
jgi:hypothetical protein